MLPPEVSSSSMFSKVLQDIEPGLSAVNVYLGLDASAEELGLKAGFVKMFKHCFVVAMQSTMGWVFRLSPLVDLGVYNFMRITMCVGPFWIFGDSVGVLLNSDVH
jgi:hypothetical protein